MPAGKPHMAGAFFDTKLEHRQYLTEATINTVVSLYIAAKIEPFAGIPMTSRR
jgi:hypothetical protein